MEFIFSQGAGLQGKTDCEARCSFEPLNSRLLKAGEGLYEGLNGVVAFTVIG